VGALDVLHERIAHAAKLLRVMPRGRHPMTTNRQVLLASRPEGWVSESNFKLVEAPLPQPAAGEVLVRNLWLSLDPYMRGRMMAVKSYARYLELGEVMVGQTIGEVIESRDPAFRTGDLVLTSLGWQLYGTAKSDAVKKVDATRAPVTYYLGLLGMPGMTAWFGLNEIGQPKAGETVVVSAASGAVGSVVGQLSKIKGCRAIGIAGGPLKCEYVVKTLGFDACIDYKAGKLYDALKAVCPDGVDVYFENVGGEIFDTMLRLMNTYARIVVCGLISDYNRTEPYPIQNLRSVLVNRIRLQGMIVTDWTNRYGEAIKDIASHLASGRIKYRETIAEGLDHAPKAFIGLLKGENLGKQLVKLA
jgi:NADPH-dependent curcumin reductase CurA